MSFLDFQITPSWNNLPKWLFLKGLSLIYAGFVRIWLAGYRFGFKRGWPADKPVISIGNITLGGTGKTPMVDWFLTFLTGKKLAPAVLTRGYKAERSTQFQLLNRESAVSGSCLQYGDEPWLLFNNHPEVTFYISADRIESAQKAQVEKTDILLMDDGMQHIRLKRDLDIVLIDAVSGVGNGQLIPLGPLREPLSSLKRADIIIYTKTNLAPSTDIRQLTAAYRHSSVREFDSQYLPYQLIPPDRSPPINPESLNQKKCLLFSGIGNPTGFLKAVESTGADVLDHLELDDHQVYNPGILEKIRIFADHTAHDYLICTEKDWVKLEENRADLPAVHRLKMKLEIESGFIDYVTDWLDAQDIANASAKK